MTERCPVCDVPLQSFEDERRGGWSVWCPLEAVPGGTDRDYTIGRGDTEQEALDEWRWMND